MLTAINKDALEVLHWQVKQKCHQDRGNQHGQQLYHVNLKQEKYIQNMLL
jgi:hypothetical protein